MFQSRKVRLKPNKAQAEFFRQNFGAARFVYNWGLEQLTKHWEENKDKEKKDREKWPTAFDLNKKLIHLKSTEEKYVWLSTVDSQLFKYVFANLDNAFKRFFTGQAKYPKFKSKRDSRQSYSTKNGKKLGRPSNERLANLKAQNLRERYELSQKRDQLNKCIDSLDWIIDLQEEEGEY